MIIAAPRASQAKVAQVGSVTQARALAQRSLRRADHAPPRMTASAAKRASVVKETNGAVISTKGISTQTTVCTRDATRAVMRSHRIIWGDPNLASVRRAHLGTLTSTDKHIQPSRSSLAAMILWGAACLTTCATSAHSILTVCPHICIIALACTLLGIIRGVPMAVGVACLV